MSDTNVVKLTDTKFYEEVEEISGRLRLFPEALYNSAHDLDCDCSSALFAIDAKSDDAAAGVKALQTRAYTLYILEDALRNLSERLDRALANCRE